MLEPALTEVSARIRPPVTQDHELVEVLLPNVAGLLPVLNEAQKTVEVGQVVLDSFETVVGGGHASKYTAKPSDRCKK